MIPEREPANELFLKARLVESQRVTQSCCLLRFSLEVGGDTPIFPSPGQFYLFDCEGGKEHLLRRPFSPCGAEWRDGKLLSSFLVEEVGWGTRKICNLEVGEVLELMGPLGRGFSLEEEGKFLLVGGGIGVAPLLFVASRLDTLDESYDLISGFESEDKVIRCFEGTRGNVEIYTEDGSVGKKGTASEALPSFLASQKYIRVCACGPEAMLAEVSRLAKRAGVPCEVSLTSRMGCGLGACRGCVKAGRGEENLCVCTDGPVFDSELLAW